MSRRCLKVISVEGKGRIEASYCDNSDATIFKINHNYSDGVYIELQSLYQVDPLLPRCLKALDCGMGALGYHICEDEYDLKFKFAKTLNDVTTMGASQSFIQE